MFLAGFFLPLVLAVSVIYLQIVFDQENTQQISSYEITVLLSFFAFVSGGIFYAVKNKMVGHLIIGVAICFACASLITLFI